MSEVESERLDKLERLIGQLGESVQRLTQGHGDERTVQRQAARIEDEFSKEELDAIREEREYRRLVARLERWETEKAKRQPEPPKDEDGDDGEDEKEEDDDGEDEEEAPPRSKRTPPSRRRPPARHKPDEEEEEQEPQPESLGGWLRQLAGGGS